MRGRENGKERKRRWERKGEIEGRKEEERFRKEGREGRDRGKGGR